MRHAIHVPHLRRVHVLPRSPCGVDIHEDHPTEAKLRQLAREGVLKEVCRNQPRTWTPPERIAAPKRETFTAEFTHAASVRGMKTLRVSGVMMGKTKMGKMGKFCQQTKSLTSLKASGPSVLPFAVESKSSCFQSQ